MKWVYKAIDCFKKNESEPEEMFMVYAISDHNISSMKKSHRPLRNYFGTNDAGGLVYYSVFNNNPNHISEELHYKFFGDYTWAMGVLDVAARAESKHLNVYMTRYNKMGWFDSTFCKELEKLNEAT